MVENFKPLQLRRRDKPGLGSMQQDRKHKAAIYSRVCTSGDVPTSPELCSPLHLLLQVALTPMRCLEVFRSIRGLAIHWNGSQTSSLGSQTSSLGPCCNIDRQLHLGSALQCPAPNCSRSMMAASDLVAVCCGAMPQPGGYNYFQEASGDSPPGRGLTLLSHLLFVVQSVGPFIHLRSKNETIDDQHSTDTYSSGTAHELLPG
jgi:hypothetical protein